MIDEEKTFELFGYHSYELSLKSDKKIVCICDKCGKERMLFKSGYRDLCKSCCKKGENNPMFGKHHSTETKEKMNKVHKGKHLSNDTKEKMSKARKGKCCGKDNPNFGKFGESHPTYIDGKWRERESCKSRGQLKPIFFLGDNYCKEENNIFAIHHMTGRTIIYIPLYMHQKNYHELKSGKGMREINNLSLKFLLEGF